MPRERADRSRSVVLFAPYAHLIGGMERVTEVLATRLGEVGWRVVVVTPASGPLVDRLLARGVVVEVVKAPASLLRYGGRPRRHHAVAAAAALPLYWWRLQPALRRGSLVHTGEHRGALLVGPAARLAGVPLVWQIHSIEASRLLDLASAVLATVVLVPSQAAADAAGWLPRHPIVVPNPVEMPTHPRSRPGGSSPPVVLSCGRLHPVKGHDHLLRALALLRDRGLPFRAVIAGARQVGHLDYARALEELVEALDLREVVELAGFCDRPFERWADAAVYVQASRHETFGLATAEAMAAGLPVVVTGVGGLAELVDDGRTGLVVPRGNEASLADALERLLADPGAAAAMGEAARAHATAQFGTGATAIEQAYRSAIARSGRRWPRCAPCPQRR